ncbi:MAG: hypothetical protein KH138_03680 [Firmicutes bacterium]|nr:hypothetical protein [Bacillota bacterium]
MEQNGIRIDIGNGRKIVVEVGCDPNLKELYVGVVENGEWIQDIAVIREPYSFDENGELKVDPNSVGVLVYGDCENEDYTDKFTIPIIEYTQN